MRSKIIADFAKLDIECPLTWDLISSGNTKGCFQLESRLGRTTARKLKPENMEQLSALISILRPGCLQAVRDGKTVTQHFIDKKNGDEAVDYFHPALEPILSKTYGEMIYQEQAMQIAKDLAGFNLQEADNLRKAIGKKKPEEMAKLKIKFIDGCKRLGIISEDQSEKIFGWIEKSQRYSFNKSHAVSYAYDSYISAYCKAHYPELFFTAYLQFARHKMDPHSEIKELYQNATEMNIVVERPDIRLLNYTFDLKDKKIFFGLTDIKGFGDSAYKSLIEMVQEENIHLGDLTWVEMIYVLNKMNSTASRALISGGALDYLKITRNRMLFEYETFQSLTNKETTILSSILDKSKSLEYNLRQLYNQKIMTKRKDVIANLVHSLNNPPYSLEDTIDWLVDTEHATLGCSISCNKVDRYDTSMINYTCQDFKYGHIAASSFMLVGELENVNITKTKKGKDVGAEMAFLTLSDGTAVLDNVICFPEKYKEYRNQIFPGNVVVIKGNKSKNKDSFIVEKIYLPRT